MAKWKRKVSIGDLHAAYQAKRLTVQELAKAVHKRLSTSPSVKRLYAEDCDYAEIVDWFQDVAEDPSSTIDDYDDCLRELYDWADDDHRLWVDTIKPVAAEVS